MAYQPLTERYSPAVVAEAEARRKKLAHGQLHVGDVAESPRVRRILDLLYQTHQTYYFAHFEASCVMSGVLFEQCIICLLEEKIADSGYITYKEVGAVKKASCSEDLADLNLNTLINAASWYYIIPPSRFNEASFIRILRNHIMHDRLPPFVLKGGSYNGDVVQDMHGVNVISNAELSKSEVSERCLHDAPEELWAYYMLTRVRSLMEDMFAERVREHPPREM
ncbi:MAG: hypothetical protein AABZ39_14285 [Spirochaetota bacterium]